MSDNYEIENEFYEEESEQHPEKVRKIKSRLKFARVVILLVMAVTASFLLFVNRDKISMDNFKRLAAKIDLGVYSTSAKDNAVIDYDYDSSAKVKAYKDGIARVGRQNLVITDNIGTQFQSLLTGFNNPQIVTTSKYVCVFDRGSNRLIVADSFSVAFDTVFEHNIVDVALNNAGYLAVITESEAYKNHVIVFDSSFKEIYKINSMTRYVVAVDISPDSRRIVVSSVYSKDQAVTPQLNCYSLSQSDSLWDVNFENSVAVDIVAKSDGTTVALFDWGVCVLDKNGKEKYSHKFGDDILQSYSITDGKYNVVVTSASQNGNSKVTVFNDSGKQISSIDLDYAVLSVDCLGDRLALLGAQSVSLYNVKGTLISTRPNPNDATYLLFSNKNLIVSVSASSAVYNLMN